MSNENNMGFPEEQPSNETKGQNDTGIDDIKHAEGRYTQHDSGKPVGYLDKSGTDSRAELSEHELQRTRLIQRRNAVLEELNSLNAKLNGN